jgi:hypothetical protein
MKRKKPYFVLINTKNFSITLCSTKETIAKTVKCHRNTLLGLSERITVNDFIIAPCTLIR